MSGLTPEKRVEEEERLVELAKALRELAKTTAGEGHEDTIVGFAEQAEKYADMINKAVTPDLAAAFIAKAAKKSAGWEELMTMLQFAQLIEGQDENSMLELQQAAVEESELKLLATATQLRAVSATGSTGVFNAIGDMATTAEEGLARFRAAELPEDKLQIFTEIEEARAAWLGQLQTMQTSINDANESEAATEAPGARDAEVDEFHDAEESCATTADPFDAAWSACMNMGSFNGEGLVSTWGQRAAARPVATSAAAPARTPATVNIPKKSAIQDPPLALACTDEEMTKHIAKYLQNGEEEGYLVTLRIAVTKAKADSSFEDVHEDATKFLEHMEVAAKVVLVESPDMEVSRAAQRGATDAKKHAFNIQKFDLYKRPGKMTKLADEHVDLLQASKVGVDLAGYLRKRSQDAILDSVTGLVAEEVAVP